MIFFVFPRVNTIALSIGGSQDRSQTGFSGQIELGSGQPIQEVQKLALQVEMQDRIWLMRSGPNALFRGKALDYFDGKSWQNTLQKRNNVCLEEHAHGTIADSEKRTPALLLRRFHK